MKKEIKKYIDLANYISVKEMYLNKDNDLNDITIKDLKPHTSGHWGTTPAINTIYANLGYYLNKNKDIKTKIIVGTGHSGLAVLTNLFLMKKLEKKYHLKPNIIGINKLIGLYGKEIRTEINPQYPDTMYDGGELGYSLPTAYGCALNNNIFIPCIIGDGEAETSTISASWQLNILLKSKLKGKVLPIINLNGLKMGSKSFLSLLTNRELKQYFRSFRYKVYFANKDNFQDCLKQAIKKQNSLIIYKSIKGESIPNNKSKVLSGSLLAHKDPLSNFNNQEKIDFIKTWLHEYNIDKNIINNMNLDNFSYTSVNFKLNKLKLPNISDFHEKKTINSSISTLAKYLAKVCNLNDKFLITSPDEAISNKVGILLSKLNLFEILNENICQCLMQGHIIGGNNGVIISYEAFMAISNTILSQFMKYIYMSKKEKDIEYNSLNYVLTSTCWENNYSHQNPEFVSNILLKEWNFVNAYYPKDANNLLHCMEKALKGKNEINVITTSKGQLPQYETINIDIEIIKDVQNPDIVLVASGDYVLKEVLESINSLEKQNIGVKLIYVTNISLLNKLSKSKKEYFFGNSKVIYCYHGYSKTIYGLLQGVLEQLLVLGYKDASDISGNSKEKLKENFLDSESIIKTVKKVLKGMV